MAVIYIVLAVHLCNTEASTHCEILRGLRLIRPLDGLIIATHDEPNVEVGYLVQMFEIHRLPEVGSGWPSWDVERYEYGEWQATASGLIVNSRTIDQANGATNRYTVVFKDSKFTIFANDDKPKTVLDSKLKAGTFAFMTWQDTGETSCTFSNAWVWVIQ